MFIEEVHDLSCMTEILIEAFKTEIYEEVINKKNFNDELLLIAKDKNEIVGFIMFTNAGIDRKTQTIPIISLTYVYVKKNFRNLGIGDQLIKKGLEIIRDRDFVLVVALLLSDVILKYGFEKAIEKNITGSFLGSEYALFVKVLKEELLDIGFQGAVKYQHGAIEWYITHELTMPSKTTCITDNKTGYIACHYTDKNVSAYKEYLQLLITYFTKQAKYIEFGIFENEKEEYRNIINLLEDHREVIWPAIPKSAKSMGTQISIRGKINENIKNIDLLYQILLYLYYLFTSFMIFYKV